MHLTISESKPMLKKPPTMNGVLHKFHVYWQGAIVGYGYIIRYPDGDTSAPELFDFRGEKLEQGWYTLEMTSESRGVVVARNIQ